MSLAADNTSARGRRRAPRPDPAAIKRVRQQMSREGKTVSDWARENGEDPIAVLHVLSGTRACTTGAQHRIAVKLGIKDGVIPERDASEADNQPPVARSDNVRDLAQPGLDPLR